MNHGPLIPQSLELMAAACSQDCSRKPSACTCRRGCEYAFPNVVGMLTGAGSSAQVESRRGGAFTSFKAFASVKSRKAAQLALTPPSRCRLQSQLFHARPNIPARSMACWNILLVVIRQLVISSCKNSKDPCHMQQPESVGLHCESGLVRLQKRKSGAFAMVPCPKDGEKIQKRRRLLFLGHALALVRLR